MASLTVLYDACVLYPAPIRDLLIQLALTDLFRAKWSSSIHDEWMAALARDKSNIDPARIERTRIMMDSHVRDCLVTGYEYMIPSLSLPHSKDCHVLAAAIRGRADVIVTYNTKHFPSEVLSEFDIDTNHPDEFITNLFDLAPARVVSSVQAIRARLKNPSMTPQEYLDSLARQRLIETVSMLRQYEDII